MGRLSRSTCLTTQHHHDCCCCSQSQEGGLQAQGCCCPPSLRRHDQGRHQGPRRQEGLLPSGHPEVRLCQLQGRRCRCCWQEGSWIIQARREAKGRQTRQGKEEARCQKGQKSRQAQEGSCQEGRDPQKGKGRQEAC